MIATAKQQWTGADTNYWTPVGATTPNLKPGMYKIAPGGMFSPWGLVEIPLTHDNVIVTGLAKQVIEEIDKFWASAETYRKFGFLHKRGVLMIGEPGAGKSMTAMLLAQHNINNGGVVIIGGRRVGLLTHALHIIRSTHPAMRIFNLMEDVEHAYNDDPIGLTSLLDGETQISGVLHVATTNVPQHLDARFLDRPGRFDSVIWVKSPDLATRRTYLAAILPADTPATTLDELATKSKGLLLSHLRDLIVATQVLGRSIDDSVAALLEMREQSKSNDDARAKLGFQQLFSTPNEADDPETIGAVAA